MESVYEGRETAFKMRLAAMAFLENLRPEQRARAMFEFGDEAARMDWDFIPKQGRIGVPMKDLDARQQVLAHELTAASLSLPAYCQVFTIIAMENLLRELN